jgi:hypothetical protein
MPKDNVFLNNYGYFMGHGTNLPNMTPNHLQWNLGKKSCGIKYLGKTFENKQGL